MDAEDHSTEKIMPEKMYLVKDLSTGVMSNKKAVHITTNSFLCNLIKSFRNANSYGN